MSVHMKHKLVEIELLVNIQQTDSDITTMSYLIIKAK